MFSTRPTCGSALRWISETACATFLTFALASAASADPISIAFDAPDNGGNQPTLHWAKTFRAALEDAGLETETFAYESIGGENERFDQTLAGILDVNMIAYGYGMQLVPVMKVALLPFAFDGAEHFERFVTDTEFLEIVNERMAPKGARVLAVVPLGGFMGIFNNKHPVENLSDLSDLRLRALDTAQLDLIQVLGAKGVVIPFAEVPTAIQTGVADGYINPIDAPLTFGHTGLLNHYTDAKAMAGARLALASQDWWDGLSDEDRAKVEDAIAAANEDIFDWAAGTVEQEMEKLVEAGFEVVDLDEAARMEFVEATEQLRDGSAIEAEGAAQILEMIEATR